MADLNLPAVPFGAQVQRLMHSYMMHSCIEKERRLRRHGLTLLPDAMLFEPLDVIAWSSAENGYEARAFEIHEMVDDLQICLKRVSLKERDPQDYSYPDGLVLPLPPVSSATTLPTAQNVPGWDMGAAVVPNASGSARRPALRLLWEGDPWGRQRVCQANRASHDAAHDSRAQIPGENHR